jgi:hypothetical protein
MANPRYWLPATASYSPAPWHRTALLAGPSRVPPEEDGGRVSALEGARIEMRPPGPHDLTRTNQAAIWCS